MPALSYDLPIADGSTATEEPKIITALSQIRNLLDQGLDTDNLSPTAGILLSQLVSGTAAQVPIVNTGGSLQYRAISGDIALAQDGGVTIPADTITNAMLAGSIDGGKLVHGAALANLVVSGDTLPDNLLSSPNNQAYKLLMHTKGTLAQMATAGGQNPPANTYLLGSGGWTWGMAGSSDLRGFDATSNPQTPPDWIRLSANDFAVDDLDTQFLIRAQVITNGTAPNRTFTFNLYDFTNGGSADAFQITVGSAALGSTATVSTPSANGAGTANSGDFDFPLNGDDQYLIGVTTSGILANDSAVQVAAQLYYRNV